jgi:uncharacterized protein (TIGR03905 family)
MYEFKTNGVCCKLITFDITDGKLRNVAFKGGCNGNLKAVGALVEGMDAAEAAKRLRGICCENRGTSCGDQLARAVEAHL